MLIIMHISILVKDFLLLVPHSIGDQMPPGLGGAIL
jgi:hypothetical protein